MEGEHVERSFVALKPDAVRRGITGKVIDMLEEPGFKIVGMKMVWADEDILQEHYSEHVDKEFYERLEEYMKSGPIVAMVFEGVNAVENIRKIVGDTNPREASPATIRGRFAHMGFEHADSEERLHKNIIHASAEPEEAVEEIDIWFDEEELHSYQQAHEEEVR